MIAIPYMRDPIQELECDAGYPKPMYTGPDGDAQHQPAITHAFSCGGNYTYGPEIALLE